MATVPFDFDAARREACTDDARRAEAAADAPLFHFGLRQLLAFVAIICGLLAVVSSTNGIVALIILLIATIVTMHVFATVLGSKLRGKTDEECLKTARLKELIEYPESISSQKLAAIRSEPRSPWHGRGATYLPWLPRFICAAMIVGGMIGAVILSQMLGHRVSPGGVMVGAASFSVLGGWIAFICGNFYGVFRHGFREALAEQRKDNHWN